jgi:hypothetical protein
MATVLAFFISLGILFQSLTVLFEKKFLLTSSLAAWGLKLSGSAALLVRRSVPSTFWNQDLLFTMSLPVMILYTWPCLSGGVSPPWLLTQALAVSLHKFLLLAQISCSLPFFSLLQHFLVCLQPWGPCRTRKLQVWPHILYVQTEKDIPVTVVEGS